MQPYLDPELVSKHTRTTPAELMPAHKAFRWSAAVDVAKRKLLLVAVGHDARWRVALAWTFDARGSLAFYREVAISLSPFGVDHAFTMHASPVEREVALQNSLGLVPVAVDDVIAWETVRSMLDDGALAELVPAVADDLRKLTRDAPLVVGNVTGFAPLLALVVACTAPGTYNAHRASIARLRAKLDDERRAQFWRQPT